MTIDDACDHITAVIERYSALGEETLDNGVRRIGHAPHVARLAYLHEVFPGLNAQQIAQLEAEIGKRFSSDLKKFLQWSNGLRLFVTTMSMSGKRDNFNRDIHAARQPFSIVTPNTIERPRGAPDDWIVFGFYDGDGSHLVCSPLQRDVFRIARRSCQILNRWDSMSDMLVSEVDRLVKLFDESGRRIDPDAPTTPPDSAG